MSSSGDLRPEAEVVVPLSEEECRALLRAGRFGRVGMTSGGLPAILPVRYVYDDDAIEFRTGDGSKLRAAQNGDVLAFEIDEYDPESGEGWSVLVLGRASVLSTGPDDPGVTRFDAPRRGVARDHSVRLLCELISGRRLAPIA